MPSALEIAAAPLTFGGSLAGGLARESSEESKRQARQKWAAENKPQDVSWNSLTDPQGNMKGQYTLQPGEQLAGLLNTDALQSLRSRSSAKGPSSWADYMTQKQQAEQTGLSDDANAGAAAAGQTAWNQLAMRGGASGGERERIALASGRGLNEERQKIAREGAAARMGILGQDESQKLDIMKALPGMELDALKPKQFDIQNKLQADQFNMGNMIAERDKAKQFELEQNKIKNIQYENENKARAEEDSGK